MLKLVCSQRSFFYFAGNPLVAQKGDICTGDFIIIPNTDAKADRFCGSAIAEVRSEFQIWWRVISKL
jgi:hypothetical protein